MSLKAKLGPLTDADRRALAVCDRLGATFTCTELGEELFGRLCNYPRMRQCYARPAGRAIRRLVDRGYVVATTRPFDRDRSKSCYALTHKSPEPEGGDL